ncbi:LytTR family DNA-binding domain-containing protein [Maribacter sp.]|nr:LytTR family DNA-binding domain-containing protein [Maribacter sp.]
MRILILEDELPAYRKLVKHLTDFFEEDLTLDHSRTVTKGLELLRSSANYDLILSDIKLLDGNSFKIFQEVEITTPIIFCTAYDQHLLEAFQTNGIAYILKPYLKADFENSLKKFQNLFQSEQVERDVFRKLREVLDSNTDSFKKRFAIKKRDGIKLLDASDISLIQAEGDFCKLVDSLGKLHSVSRSIGALAVELDPTLFFKINRSQIVNIKWIVKIEPYAKNRLAIRMEAVDKVVVTSSATTKDFRKWLEN